MKVKIKDTYLEIENDNSYLGASVFRDGAGNGASALIFNAYGLVERGGRYYTNENKINEIEDCHETEITYHPVSLKLAHCCITVKFYLFTAGLAIFLTQQTDGKK